MMGRMAKASSGGGSGFCARAWTATASAHKAASPKRILLRFMFPLLRSVSGYGPEKLTLNDANRRLPRYS